MLGVGLDQPTDLAEDVSRHVCHSMFFFQINHLENTQIDALKRLNRVPSLVVNEPIWSNLAIVMLVTQEHVVKAGYQTRWLQKDLKGILHGFSNVTEKLFALFICRRFSRFVIYSWYIYIHVQNVHLKALRSRTFEVCHPWPTSIGCLFPGIPEDEGGLDLLIKFGGLHVVIPRNRTFINKTFWTNDFFSAGHWQRTVKTWNSWARHS